MTENLARFTINGSPSEDANGKRGYDATAGEGLAITLEKNPSLSVLTATYELNDLNDSASPFNSLFDTAQVFVENSLPKIIVTAPNQTVNITVNPSTEISAYNLRCTVVTAQGAHVFERLLVIRKIGLRLTIPAESAQYAQRGWSDALNELTKAVADGGVSVALVSSSNTGIVNAYTAGQSRIFHSDGSTTGGKWDQLTTSINNQAFLDRSIPPIKIEQAEVSGWVLTTTGGDAIWAPPPGMTRPTSPGEDNLVAVASSNDLTYIQLTNIHIAAGANIAVAKLAPGSNDQVLKTIGGVAAWGIDSQLMAPANPGEDGRVALASGGDLVYGLISDAQVSASAAIAVSKLSVGTEGQIVKIVAGVPVWAAEGGGGANLPNTPADDDKMAFANTGNLDYADGVHMLNVGTTQDVISLAGTRHSDSASTPTTPSGNEGVLWNNAKALTWTTADGDFNVLRSAQPADPADDSKVAIALGGELSYAFIVDANVLATAAIEASKLGGGAAHTLAITNSGGTAVAWELIDNDNIASAAGIAVDKLAFGSEGQYLRTIASATVWSSVLDGGHLTLASVNIDKLIDGAPNTVLVTDAGDTAAWVALTNDYIDMSANIAVTKLAAGAANSVLASNGTANFWDTSPTVDTILANNAFMTPGYMELQATGSPGEPSAAPEWGVRLFAEVQVLKCIFDDTTIWELASEAFDIV